MPPKKGMIVLMGSGELTPTMVEVHKSLLAGLPQQPPPVFMDTPAGFQLNVDEISQKAVAYFNHHVESPLTVASIKSAEDADTYEFQTACKTLEAAHYILIGPGSPTYAVRQWTRTRIPAILTANLNAGGRLVAASAAALTMGRFTLPVYEIYKVGQPLHWVDGMDILSQFGLDLVVIPHWNNAEGGTHDTRYCYMGQSRFEKLISMLPGEVGILGVDEHTACIIDFENHLCTAYGNGTVTHLLKGEETSFDAGQTFSLDVLHGKKDRPSSAAPSPVHPAECPDPARNPYMDAIVSCERDLKKGLKHHDPKAIADTLLEMENIIWETRGTDTDDHCVGMARDILKKSFALLSEKIEGHVKKETASFNPLVDSLMTLRDRYRSDRKFSEADAIRDCLEKAGIRIIDDKEMSRWELEV